MTNDYGSGNVRISAGTAIKIGFFGALGATLFSLIITAIGAIVLLVLGLLGLGIANFNWR